MHHATAPAYITLRSYGSTPGGKLVFQGSEGPEAVAIKKTGSNALLTVTAGDNSVFEATEDLFSEIRDSPVAVQSIQAGNIGSLWDFNIKAGAAQDGILSAGTKVKDVVVAYDKAEKLNDEFTVVAVPEGDAAVGEGNIAYDPAGKKLWVGADTAVTLRANLDEELIADLGVIFAADGLEPTDKVTFDSGVLKRVTLVVPKDGKVATTLLTKADIIVHARSNITVLAGDVLDIPPGRSITLNHFIVGHSSGYIWLNAGGKLLTGASSDIAAIATNPTTLTVMGDHASTPGNDCSGITSTPQVVRSIQAGIGTYVRIAGGDGVVNADTTFKDGG
jgi:hypothetical protein